MIETWSINRNHPLILWNKTMHAIVFAQVSLTVYYFSILKLSCFKKTQFISCSQQSNDFNRLAETDFDFSQKDN